MRAHESCTALPDRRTGRLAGRARQTSTLPARAASFLPSRAPRRARESQFLMAYLGNSTRDRTGAQRPPAPTPAADASVRRAPLAPDGTPRRSSRDWPAPSERTTSFSAGVMVGLTLGAGLALLLAPRSGPETRAVLRRSARRAGRRGRNVWDDLYDELRVAGRQGQKRVRRTIQRGGWAAEDAIDERRLARRQARAAREALEC